MVGQSPDGKDMRACYARAVDAPVWTGDYISGRRVIGFCHGKVGDHILVEGEENLSEPPDRPLTCQGNPAGVERTGPSPAENLPADRLQPVPDGLRTAVEDALGTREDGQFVRRLLDEISALRHHAWLVGGSVRDLLAAVPGAVVKDFDVTGTIGPDCLNSMVSLRRRSGVGDYIPWLSPESNVWSVTPPGQRSQRLIEYKPLARPGFRFPVWGGSLEEDTTTRDLTFNALYYDRNAGALADPCGTGRSDLSMGVMATPLRSTDPVEQASVVLRSMKFRLRYPELDVSQMVSWIRDELPEDWAAHVPDLGWKRLVMTRRWSVLRELSGRDELAAAGEFGQKAVQLVLEIRKRA
jgi:hypothetical protein